MKITLVVALLSAFALPAFAIPAYVTWDATYGNPDTPLNAVSCSDGKNGLLAKDYTNFASLPFIPQHRSLKYTTPRGHQTTVYITAVDNAYTYNISPQAFEKLIDSTVFETGKVKARAIRVPDSKCGM
ncbi:hypothetical protein EDB19DRAFT_1824928 [Suillus lakei]|nr:hypothetical protein EDB19DRAFT_1824928 [Suillus lakei]